jgi:hypothetical protein
MNSINPKELLVIGVTVGIVAWLLWPHHAGGQRSHVPLRHVAAPSIGARNHSGGEPHDLFGLRPGQGDAEDSDLLEEGRRP